MDAVEVYKLVLEKKHIKTFPKGFWQQPEAIDNAIKCTKYLIEEKLNLSKEELKKQLSMKLFIENGLSGMLTTCFNNSFLFIRGSFATYTPLKYIISKAWNVIYPSSVCLRIASSYLQFKVLDTSLKSLPSILISPSSIVP